MIDIPGYEGLYAIDKTGRIYSYLRKREIFAWFDGDYMCVELCGKKKKIHVLLALTFLDNPENLPTVDHIDQNKLNNDLSNLRWASWKTQVENQEHNNHEVVKRPIEQLDKDGNVINEFASIKEASILLNIDPSSITKVCVGKRKTAGKFGWRYKEDKYHGKYH